MGKSIRSTKRETELPDSRQIKKVAKILQSRDFLYLASFADMLNRYIEIRFSKHKGFNRLRFGALSFLITRGGSLTPTKLGKLMFRSKRCITNIIDLMEREGYVKRERVNEDRRVNLVKITSVGVDFLLRMVEDRTEDEDNILFSVNEDDYKAMMGVIRQLRHNLTQKINL